MIPLILKPKLYALRNRWRRAAGSPRRLIQDLMLLGMCAALMLLLFLGTLDAVERLKQLSQLAYLPAAQPLAIFLLPLLLMLAVSSTVIAIGALFLSRDLDRLLSAPLPKTSFFAGKFVYVLTASAWMPFMFMAPVLAAFGISYHAAWHFYLMAPVLLAPYFIIPAALAFTAAALFTMAVPANRTREILLLTALMALILICMLLDTLGLSPRSLASSGQVLRMISILSMPSRSWLPSNWVSRCLQQLLEPVGPGAFPEFALLFCSAAACSALAYISFDKLHAPARSKALGIRQELRDGGPRRRPASGSRLRRWLSPQQYGLLRKEYTLCLREITQALQITLLVGLCMIYLYNLKVFGDVAELPEKVRLTWRQFLLVGNVAVGSFAITAVCTRFVFPSISLEGPSFWIIAAAPLEVRQIIRSKFWFWFTPIALLAEVFFAVGAHTIGADAFQVILCVFSAGVVCYGVTGLGMGLGAFYANFNWEHPSELVASFGGFAYMLLSIALILFSLAPVITLILIERWGTQHFFGLDRTLAAAGCLLLLVGLNYFAAQVSLRLGERALLRQFE